MTTKTYVVEFYVGQMGADGNAGRVSALLKRMVNGRVHKVFEQGEHVFEVRDLTSHNEGVSFSGVLAKFRSDDLPHVGEPGGNEEELPIQDNQGLIEKNHFLYFRNRELLVWQRNRNGCGITRFEKCLSEASGETTIFNPVYQPDAARRLMRGEVTPLSLEFSMARPTNPEFFPKNEWNEGVMDIMSRAGGARFHIKITSDQRSGDRDKRTLAQRMKAAGKELAGMDGIGVVRFDVDDNGVRHPIDLIADRITSRQSVEMNGRYPVKEAMFAALRKGRDEEKRALNEYFGVAGHALD